MTTGRFFRNRPWDWEGHQTSGKERHPAPGSEEGAHAEAAGGWGWGWRDGPAERRGGVAPGRREYRVLLGFRLYGLRV